MYCNKTEKKRKKPISCSDRISNESYCSVPCTQHCHTCCNNTKITGIKLDHLQKRVEKTLGSKFVGTKEHDARKRDEPVTYGHLCLNVSITICHVIFEKLLTFPQLTNDVRQRFAH